MANKLRHLIVQVVLAGISGVAAADPPIPSHTIEGNSGVLITSTAYLTNPAQEGDLLSKPSFSATALFFDEKDFESFAVTENIDGNMEIGYAYQRLGMGGWSDDAKNALGVTINQHVGLHNFNLRYQAIQEGDLDLTWMPAVTFGGHLKWNESQVDLDEDVAGLLDLLGSDHSGGAEATVVASKRVEELLPWPIVISGGVRNGDAIQTGLLGFAGERKTTFEGSIVAFLFEKLAIAAEYRQKPDLMRTFSRFGHDLIKEEDDWFTVAMAYSINEVTVAGAYANFASFADRNEDNVLGVQLRYDF